MSVTLYARPASAMFFAAAGLSMASLVLGERLKEGLKSTDAMTKEVSRRCLSLSSLETVSDNLSGIFSDCRDRAIVACSAEKETFESCSNDLVDSCESQEEQYGSCLDQKCLEEKTALEKVYDAYVSVKALCDSAINQKIKPDL